MTRAGMRGAVGVGAFLRAWRPSPGAAPDAPSGPLRRSEGGLIAVKAVVLLAAAVMLFASRPALVPRTVLNGSLRVSMRCPRGWSGCTALYGITAYRADGALQAVAALWRLPRRQLRSVYEEFSPRLPEVWPRTDQEGCLEDIAAAFGYAGRADWSLVEPVTLAGRRALMLAAPCRSFELPWGAIVVAAGEEILLLDLHVSGQTELRRVWPQYKAMMRSVRVTGAREP